MDTKPQHTTQQQSVLKEIPFPVGEGLGACTSYSNCLTAFDGKGLGMDAAPDLNNNLIKI